MTESDGGSDVNGSICPAGWKIPANYSVAPSRSFGSITDVYGATVNGANNRQNHVSKLESFPLNFVRTGRHISGSLDSNGVVAKLWSSTAYTTNDNAYNFHYDGSVPYTYPQNWDPKYRGYVLRCVAI